ncbi:MAG: type II toxin-antitoxin system VapC family toxin [Solirubrobacterales bacterium]
MTLVVDAAPLVALADEREPRRGDILALMRSETDGLFIPAPVTAEIDYLLGRRFGPPARHAFLEDLAARRYETPGLDARDHADALEFDRRYADLDLGLADVSIVVLARKLGTRRILTFDERHFRAVRPLQGGVFTLLPADARPAA